LPFFNRNFTIYQLPTLYAGVPHYTYHCIRHFVASYLYDKKKVSLPVISKLLRHKGLQTTEIYFQAIDPSFRETMRLLEGNVMGFLGEQLADEATYPRPTHRPGPKRKGSKF
jgi:hypothetical protein